MNDDEPPCGLDVALAVMGGKWKPMILYHLNSGPKRFGELRRLLAGISEKVLVQQLRELAVFGVLVRHDHGRMPLVVDYTTTAFGMTLVRALMPLCAWGMEHRARLGAVASFSVRAPAGIAPPRASLDDYMCDRHDYVCNR